MGSTDDDRLVMPKYLCMAPWTHTYLSPQTERRMCCASREPAQNFEQYIDKKISFQFLVGISLPTDIKRNILLLENENKRLFYINDLFKKVLSQKIEADERDLPEA